MKISEKQAKGIQEIWDGLSTYPASAIDQSLPYLLDALCGLVDAQDACWAGSVRMDSEDIPPNDPLLGWRLSAIHLMTQDPEYLDLARKIKKSHADDPPMPNIVMMREAGVLRVRRLMAGMVDMESYRKTESYFPFEKLGIVDRLYCSIPASDTIESHFILDRKGDRPPFGETDAELILQAVAGIPWFVKEVSLAYGLRMNNQSLSPTERRIVRHLLTDLTEVEIAEKLGQSPKTTHKYVTEIYRKYDVRGRAGLAALWLRQ